MKTITLKSLDVDVINFILHNNKATIDELSNCFDVSQVNIRTVLSKIEEFISKQNLGKLLKENGYYYFENNNINFNFNLNDFLIDDLEKKERIVYIVLKLILEGSINLSSISKELNVSRITLNSDLEVIKELINDFQLKLTSIQWKGVFFEGELYELQKFSVLFISKLYIENYFSSPLKKIINPVVYSYFRELLSEETEKKLFNLADRLYYYFNINLGKYHYYFLVALLIYIHLGTKKDIEFFNTFKTTPLDLTEALNDILELEDRELIGNNIMLIIVYLSVCINKKYSIIFPVNIDEVIDAIYSIFNLDKHSSTSQLLGFFINDIYFENRFFIPIYTKFDKDDEKILDDEISLKLIFIFEKYQIPFTKKDIGFLYYFLKDELTQIKKKNVLIIDRSIMTWKANKLKEKLKYLEQVNLVQIYSYFNFKFFPIETYNKYDVFIFIDLPNEKKYSYSKQCCFINGYELLKNSIDITKLF